MSRSLLSLYQSKFLTLVPHQFHPLSAQLRGVINQLSMYEAMILVEAHSHLLAVLLNLKDGHENISHCPSRCVGGRCSLDCRPGVDMCSRPPDFSHDNPLHLSYASVQPRRHHRCYIGLSLPWKNGNHEAPEAVGSLAREMVSGNRECSRLRRGAVRITDPLEREDPLKQHYQRSAGIATQAPELIRGTAAILDNRPLKVGAMQATIAPSVAKAAKCMPLLIRWAICSPCW